MSSGFVRTVKVKSGEFEIPEEMLHATPECLEERYCNVTNHDSGLRRILFDLTEAHDLVIDGGGREFRLNGRMIPFLIANARNVIFRNFILNWERPMYSQAKVIASSRNSIDLEFPPEMPVRIENNRFLFYGPCYEAAMHSFHYSKIVEVNPQRRETEYKILPNACDREGNLLALNCSAEKLSNGIFRLHGKFESPFCAGNYAVFVHEGRTSPGFVIDRSRNVKFEEVTIKHAGGMGIVAQKSRDIVLERVRVTPSQGRLFSVCYDATHFVDCGGKIVIKDCFFENQFDDHANIHGLFRPITAQLSSTSLLIGLAHPQQRGIETFSPGDVAGFWGRMNFEAYGSYPIASVEAINGERSIIDFCAPLPKLDFSQLCAMLIDHSTEVEISGSTFRKNRSRGLLLSTLGKVRVHDNYIHVPMAGIKISGDMNNWFEAGPVEDVDIYGNFFDCCNYGVGSKALFELDPEVLAEHMPTRFHRNIRIHDNRICYFQEPLFFSCCFVDDVRIENNTLEKIRTYPPVRQSRRTDHSGARAIRAT